LPLGQRSGGEEKKSGEQSVASVAAVKNPCTVAMKAKPEKKTFIDLGKCGKKAAIASSPKASTSSDDWQKGSGKVCWTCMATGQLMLRIIHSTHENEAFCMTFLHDTD
jgi:hypothetical protein